MLNEHELRRAIVSEMHLRRWPQVSAPSSIIQFVRVLAPEDREAEQRALSSLSTDAPAECGDNPLHLQHTLAPGLTFTWERHSEASTTTLFIADGDPTSLLESRFAPAVKDALEWMQGLPGKVIRATRLLLMADEAAATAFLPQAGFSDEDLVSCHIGADGNSETAARIWSDFRLRPNGFGVVLVAANGMARGDFTRTLQRLQELGNYRNLALLGLPVARAGWKTLDQIEAMLGAMNRSVALPEITDDQLLEEVTNLSIELISQATASDYRMSATEAYANIVEERLEDLHIRPCSGYLSLADFTQRRLLPAVRTCAAHRRRTEQLAQRTEQFVALFRTRIETRIENQNGRLLASMERSATRQLRLQQLVEGLSVVAVSYYSLGLIAKMLEGLESRLPGVDLPVLSALLVPVVLVVVWFGLHHMKRRILSPAKDGAA